MGPRLISLLLPVLLGLAATAAHAQTQGGGGVLQDFQLDPARDPNRPQAPEREGPEIERLPTTPTPTPSLPPPVTITPPPVQLPSPAPAQPATPRPTAPAPAQPSRGTAPVAPSPAPAVPPTADVPTDAPAPQPEAEAPMADSTPVPASTPEETAPADPESASSGWLLPLALAAAAFIAFLLFRRRSRPKAAEIDDTDASPEVESVGDAPSERTVPATAAAPTPAPPAPARRVREEARPWVQIEFQAESARSTLVGAAVAYRLTLRNSGTRPAEQVEVGAFITNATAQQPALLAAFFSAPVAAPVHRIAALQPGEAVELRGELRIDHGAIVPIRVQDRALLIPVVAFNAVYRWPAIDGAPGAGQTGAAFIVGQESDPPRAKMAPFRLDQGPRQYRSVGSRPAQQAQVA